MSKFIDYEGTRLIANEFANSINDNKKKIADMDTEIGMLKHDVKILKSVLIFTMLLIVLLIIGVIMPLIPAEAAEITMADESLGGFSYMMDCLEKNDIPEDYKKILRMWHPAYNVTQDEYDILVRIVEAEATGGNHEQKMNVASCVLARVEAPQWPDNIEDVVFQKQQFTPIWDGRYFSVKIQESTKKAVDEVLKFGKTHDCLWFCSDKSYTKKDGNGRYTSWHRTEFGDSIFFDGEHHYFEGEKYD